MYVCMCTCTSLQGHFKVVKYLVEHVSQFPSDSELTRYIGTLSDKVGIHHSALHVIAVLGRE